MTAPTRYLTRRFEVQAVQYDGSDASVAAIAALVGRAPEDIEDRDGVWIDTTDGDSLRVWPGDYVVKTDAGIEVVKPGPFRAQFERVDGAVG